MTGWTAANPRLERTVRDLVVGSGLEFDERGEHELRGIDGRWRLLAARPDRGRTA